MIYTEPRDRKAVPRPAQSRPGWPLTAADGRPFHQQAQPKFPPCRGAAK
jgi:hypothetical protein